MNLFEDKLQTTVVTNCDILGVCGESGIKIYVKIFKWQIELDWLL